MFSSVPDSKRNLNFIQRVRKFFLIVFSLLLVSSVFSAAHAQNSSQSNAQGAAPAGGQSGAAAQTSAPPPSLLPDAPGKQVVVQKCTQCHGPEMFALSRKTSDDWDQVITKMTSNGLVISDEEYDIIMDYLTKNLGPLPPKINVNKAAAADLQKGLGVTDVEAQAIVKFRTDHGDFKDWHDVAKVDGVDPKKIEAKKDAIAF